MLPQKNGVAEGEEYYVSYLINDELHDMIRGAELRNVNYVLEAMPDED